MGGGVNPEHAWSAESQLSARTWKPPRQRQQHASHQAAPQPGTFCPLSDQRRPEFPRRSQAAMSLRHLLRTFSLPGSSFLPLIIISGCWFLRVRQQLATTDMGEPAPLVTVWAFLTGLITRTVSECFHMPWNVLISPFVLHLYLFTSRHPSGPASDSDIYSPTGFPEEIQNQAEDGIPENRSPIARCSCRRGQRASSVCLSYPNLNHRDWTGQANPLFQFCYLIKTLKLPSARECSHIIHFPYPMLTKQ